MAGKINYHEKLHFKMAQVARYRVAGLKDEKIMELTGLTRAGLSRIVADEDYKQVVADVNNGLLSKMDELLEQRADALECQLSAAVPAALQCIIDGVTQGRDLKERMMASKEVLDRDPAKRFAKKSIAPSDAANAPPTGRFGGGSLPAVLSATVTREHNELLEKMQQQQAPVVVVPPAQGMN